MQATLETRMDAAQPYKWNFALDAFMSENYDFGDDSLNAIYQKAKANQWDVNTDLDWSSELSADNPLGMPDGTLLIYGSDVWNKLDAKGRAEVRHHSQGWTLSQVLHGEQAALICASKLAVAEESLSARLCAAGQIMDEARHIEAFGRLVNDKLPISYPMSQSLKSLLGDTISSSHLDITNLGMQVLVEGIALSLFQSIVAYTQDPFIRDLVTRIQRDEARHFAIGRITLCRVYKEMTDTERKEREEFVAEGAHTLHEHLCADDIWEPMGLSKKECGHLVRNSPVTSSMRRSIFRRLVPTIREMGLLSPRVQRVFEQLQVMDYAAMPLPA
ncbi:ferritin-like domain-containing protein [Chromobacterium vaccinii]|uniref:ferritin-like domain-containing protein n=1 Tax=Chromobacterium vaccinii TaxID=1108595 RepID=UPI0018F893D5|nr:ferritin-like domain-containing protein [Chromobacterium vaccinii]